MKVVAIRDAVITNKKWPNGTYRAYYRGDIFDTSDWLGPGNEKSIVYKNGPYDKLFITEENFVTLEEWRELQLQKLEI